MSPYQHSFSGNIPQDVTGKQGENVIFIVYILKDSPETLDKVKGVYVNFSVLIRSIRNRSPDMMFGRTMGFGTDAWNRLFPGQGKPKELKIFKEIKGEKHIAVLISDDLLLHIRAKQTGLCFKFVSIIDEKLQGVVEPADETHGFRHMGSKAIIGFVDETEDPTVDENLYYLAVVGEEDAGFAGGSYIFMQKYIHDMVAWSSLPVEEQEEVIERHRLNDVELFDGEKPQNAHNAVTNIEDDLKIVHTNMPLANTSKGEYGIYFTGYASTFTTTRQMLESMFTGNPIGSTDRLPDFSIVVTGTPFFASSYDLLGELGE